MSLGLCNGVEYDINVGCMLDMTKNLLCIRMLYDNRSTIHVQSSIAQEKLWV